MDQSHQVKRARRKMSLELAGIGAVGLRGGDLRGLVENDALDLANLMFNAYRGTTDDEGQPLEAAVAEVRGTFEGHYGRMIWDASFVALAPGAPFGLASASVVTLWNEAPLLAFSMTQPDVVRQGLASRAIRASARALSTLGYRTISLVVTSGNAPAERLYEKLGFRDTP